MRLSRGASLGPYQIVSLLGSGGMGEVYRARDTRLERTVAIKVLPGSQAQEPERRQRFVREARAISALSHPHICAVYDVGQEQGHDYLVMEYLEGETLAERLRKGPLPAEQAMRYAVEIAVALAAAHRQGVVHRDLKPANIMLTRSGAKLLDFGLAKVQETSAELSELSQLPTDPLHASLTVEGTIMGTLHYMAPEQLEGRAIDSRTDIFAFGAVLYEMASGKKAFAGASQASVIGAILHTEPAPLAKLLSLTPPGLDRAVRKCLAKDPDQRWQTAQDLADELLWLGQGEMPAGGPAPPRERRVSWGWMAAAGALAGAAGLALGLLHTRPEARRHVRATVLLPEGHILSSSGGALALSPDGRQLAFVARASDGKEMLWVRPLHGLSAQALAGTEGATSPFWAPDGKRLAYFAGGKLRRIDASGGASQVLCDAYLGRGGSWGREGVIVFTPDVALPIHRVAETGGPSRPVTHLERGRGENSHRWPVFLADGRHFLYVAWRGAGLAAHDIYVASLDGGEPQRLLRAASHAAFVPPDRLLFVRHGNLEAQRFDPRTLRLEGEPVPVGEKVQRSPVHGAGTFAVSATGVLAYQAAAEADQAQLVWLDRRGQVIAEVAASGDDSSPRLSGDGRWLATTSVDPASDGQDIRLRDLSRQVDIRVTVDPAEDSFPVWSRDGTRLVFSSTRHGAAGDLFVKAAAAGGPEELALASPERKIPTDWSPDGRHLAFHTISPATGADLWILSLPEHKAAPLLQSATDESEGEFSPDGGWIAYRSQESGRAEIYVRPFPGPGTPIQVSAQGGRMPKWRADGRELYYVDNEWRLVAVPVTQRAGRVEVGTPRALFSAHMRDLGHRQYDVSVDGARFLVSRLVKTENLSPITLVLDWTDLQP
jgi:Tol biopolymer transport system component/predicted Ser/Thr protein kinase